MFSAYAQEQYATFGAEEMEVIALAAEMAARAGELHEVARLLTSLAAATERFDERKMIPATVDGS